MQPSLHTQHTTESFSQSAHTWNIGLATSTDVDVPPSTLIMRPCNISWGKINSQAASGTTWTDSSNTTTR